MMIWAQVLIVFVCLLRSGLILLGSVMSLCCFNFHYFFEFDIHNHNPYASHICIVCCFIIFTVCIYPVVCLFSISYIITFMLSFKVCSFKSSINATFFIFLVPCWKFLLFYCCRWCYLQHSISNSSGLFFLIHFCLYYSGGYYFRQGNLYFGRASWWGWNNSRMQSTEYPSY